MKNKTLIIVLSAVMVFAVILGVTAVVIYPKLAGDYTASELADISSITQAQPEDEQVSSANASSTQPAVSNDVSSQNSSEQSSAAQKPAATTNSSSSKTSSINVNRAKDFTVYDKNSNTVSLSDNIGKPTVVNFWATWCGYCVQELPDFNKLYNEYKGKVNFMMVDLADSNGETRSNALSFVSNSGFTFPVYFDYGSAANSYNISGIPRTLFINADGSLYKDQVGMMNESTIRAYLEAITKEPVVIALTNHIITN